VDQQPVSLPRSGGASGYLLTLRLMRLFLFLLENPLPAPWRSALVLVSVTLAAPLVVALEQTITPHEHQGVIPAYRGAPPSIRLTAEEKEILERGQFIRRVEQLDSNVQAVTIFNVNAPTECVWSVLLDFPAYSRGLRNMLESEVYRTDGHDFYVRFRYRHWLLGNYIYFIRHTYPGSASGWGTWTLDYDHRSDLDDSVGFWRVEPVAGNATRSRVFYSAKVLYKGWAPAWLRRIFAEGALAETAAWVGKHSETRWTSAGGNQCAPA
jgi:hypothetical protein